MARARSAVLQAAVLILSVVRHSAAAVDGSRELLQSSPAESPDTGFGLFGSAEPPGLAQVDYTTYQYVAPALAVPNSYFTINTDHETLGPYASINTEVASAPPPPDGDGDPADDLISAGIVAASAALLQCGLILNTLQILTVGDMKAIMEPLASQLVALGDLIRLLVPLASYGADLDARFPNYGLLVEQWQAFLNSFVDFPETAIVDQGIGIDSIKDIVTTSNPGELSQVQLFIYWFYYFVNPAVETLTTYLADPTSLTGQTAFLLAAANASTSTGTTYVPVSVFLNFAAVATNPSGACQGYPTSKIYAEVIYTAGGPAAALCLFDFIDGPHGLGLEIGFDRSQYQPYAAALASYALLTGVMADATNAITNVVYDGGAGREWTQAYTNNQGWYITWIENVVAYYSNMAIFFWNAQLGLDFSNAYQKALNANFNNALSTQQLANGFSNYFTPKYPFLDWGFVFWTPSATSGTSLDGGQEAWGIPGGCQAGVGAQPSSGNEPKYLVPPTTATAAACTTNGGSIFVPYLTIADNSGNNPINTGLMIFFKNVEDNTPVPNSNSLTATFTACQTVSNNGGSAETIATCINDKLGSPRATLMVSNTQEWEIQSSLSTSVVPAYQSVPAAGADTSGGLFAVLPNAVGSGPAASPGAGPELAPPPTDSPAAAAAASDGLAPTPAGGTPPTASDGLAPTPASGTPPTAPDDDLAPAPTDGPSPSAR